MLSCKGAVMAALAGSAAAFVAPQVISARRHPRLPPALGRAGRAPQLHIPTAVRGDAGGTID
jgi:hypothetical protein